MATDEARPTRGARGPWAGGSFEPGAES